MEDETKPESPGAFLSGMREGIRKDVRAEVEKDYRDRLWEAHQNLRRAQDLADSQRICASQEQEQMAARMAEYRRGKWYHLGAVVASACSGFAAGYLAQKTIDLRLRGVPVMSVAGLPGLGFGAVLDESMAARASLAVGGAMFTIGTITYAVAHPLPPDAGGEEKIA